MPSYDGAELGRSAYSSYWRTKTQSGVSSAVNSKRRYFAMFGISFRSIPLPTELLAFQDADADMGVCKYAEQKFELTKPSI